MFYAFFALISLEIKNRNFIIVLYAKMRFPSLLFLIRKVCSTTKTIASTTALD